MAQRPDHDAGLARFVAGAVPAGALLVIQVLVQGREPSLVVHPLVQARHLGRAQAQRVRRLFRPLDDVAPIEGVFFHGREDSGVQSQNLNLPGQFSDEPIGEGLRPLLCPAEGVHSGAALMRVRLERIVRPIFHALRRLPFLQTATGPEYCVPYHQPIAEIQMCASCVPWLDYYNPRSLIWAYPCQSGITVRIACTQ